MCLFCAAIPVAASIGAAANSKQKQLLHQAEEKGTPPPHVTIPAGRATLVVVGVLTVGSILYHTQLKLPY